MVFVFVYMCVCVCVCVQVYGEATLIFPLLVAETFARVYREPPTHRREPEK